jgi:hypothetical protein
MTKNLVLMIQVHIQNQILLRQWADQVDSKIKGVNGQRLTVNGKNQSLSFRIPDRG